MSIKEMTVLDEAITAQEWMAKMRLMKVLNRQGYKAYAKILENLEFHLTKVPGDLAYMDPHTAEIFINWDFDGNKLDEKTKDEYLSVFVRHEILHSYLEHYRRLLEKIAEEKGLDKNALTDIEISDLEKVLFKPELFNIPSFGGVTPVTALNLAGDYEISNRGYTERDKELQRKIIRANGVTRGLVTEDDHPDWVNLSIEEMYDRLRQEKIDLPSPPEGEGQGGGMSDQGQGQDQSTTNNGSSSRNDGGQASNKKDSKVYSGYGFKGKILPDGTFVDQNGDPIIPQIQKAATLKEELTKAYDKYSFTDEDTGDIYLWNGSTFVKATDGDDGSPIAVKWDGHAPIVKNNLERRTDAEAEAQRKKEQEEREANDVSDKVNAPSVEQRKAELQKIKNDPDLQKKLEEPVIINRRKEQRDAEGETKTKTTALRKFKMSVDRFLAKVLNDPKYYSTWTMPKRRYIATGKKFQGQREEDRYVPLINIYFDNSGSWTSGSEGSRLFDLGLKALTSLNQYVRRGELKVRIRYFSEYKLYTQPLKSGGGTYAAPVWEDIKETKPDNVIIMTDSDFDGTDGNSMEPCIVPGGVWFLFAGEECKSIKSKLKGRMLTESFLMSWEEIEQHGANR